MKTAYSMALVALLVLSGGLMGVAPTPPATKPAPVAGPKNESGLTATLIANEETYVLDPAQSGKEFRDRIEGMKKGPGIPPKPPAVDLVLRLTNTTDRDFTFMLGGDNSNVSLKVEGPVAVMIGPNMAMTMEFRMGKPLLIGAGKTADIKIMSLANGMRGMTEYNYWTEPGEYTITATLTYPNAAEDKELTVTSAPTKVTVTKG